MKETSKETQSNQQQNKQNEVNQKIQTCKMFDVYIKDIKNEGEKNG